MRIFNKIKDMFAGKPAKVERTHAENLALKITSNGFEGIRQVHDELVVDNVQNFEMKKNVAAKLLGHEGVQPHPRRVGELFAMQAARGFAQLGMLDETRRTLDLLAQKGRSRDDILRMIEAGSEKVNDPMLRYSEDTLEHLVILSAAAITLPKYYQGEETFHVDYGPLYTFAIAAEEKLEAERRAQQKAKLKLV